MQLIINKWTESDEISMSINPAAKEKEERQTWGPEVRRPRTLSITVVEKHVR